MNAKTIVWILVIVFLAIVISGFLSGRAKGDMDGKLSREEQIQIMSECYSDARGSKKGFFYDGFTQGAQYTQQWIVATAFFQYRTKDR